MSFLPIEKLLPHRPPMLWIDEVVSRGDDSVCCKLTIRDDHVFVEHGRVEPLIALEWMAQAVAVLVGLRDRDQDQTPRPGYLIAIPQGSLDVEDFRVGDELRIDVRRVWGDDALASFECAVTRAGEPCASAQLSVYRSSRAAETAP